jgi:hypothetical protein
MIRSTNTDGAQQHLRRKLLTRSAFVAAASCTPGCGRPLERTLRPQRRGYQHSRNLITFW